jgi:hypothetical protein
MTNNMIGYGMMPYKSKSGREGEWPVLGLASQKNYVSFYSCVTEKGEYLAEKMAEKLGKAMIGKSCVRYLREDQIEWKGLTQLVRESQRIGLSRGIF